MTKGFDDGYLGRPKIFLGDDLTYLKDYEDGAKVRFQDELEKKRKEVEAIQRFQQEQDDLQMRLEQDKLFNNINDNNFWKK